ncbi:DUF4123 domain-containing protein [Zymobacter sp. IVIA_12111.31 C1]|uniref:DUF4123 domain-containing protein n=1 Tax=Zymobacter sp. IVIA_12111.31 C1 TaxID=3394854 RepID=UPI0039C064E3
MIADASSAPPPRYLLLNPRHQDPQHLTSARDVTPDKGLYVIHQPHLKQPAHWALRLIDLHQRPDIKEEAEEWLKAKRWPRETFGGWLVTTASPPKMVTHLEGQLVQHTADRRRMLLRYFDPRVLDQLEHILDEGQRSTLMGPITHWTLLDAHCTPHTLVCSSARSPFRCIDQHQWQAISYTDEVEHIRRAWVDYIAPARLPDDHYRIIVAWLTIADQQGLDDSTDRITFVLIGTQLRWRFDTTPRFHQLMIRHRTEGHPLTAMLNAMTAKEWALIEQWTPREPCPA